MHLRVVPTRQRTTWGTENLQHSRRDTPSCPSSLYLRELLKLYFWNTGTAARIWATEDCQNGTGIGTMAFRTSSSRKEENEGFGELLTVVMVAHRPEHHTQSVSFGSVVWLRSTACIVVLSR